jgi:hypothetical protein
MNPSRYETRLRDAGDVRLQAEAQLATELQREQPGLARTAALMAARQMVARVDFTDGKVVTLSTQRTNSGLSQA